MNLLLASDLCIILYFGLFRWILLPVLFLFFIKNLWKLRPPAFLCYILECFVGECTFAWINISDSMSVLLCSQDCPLHWSCDLPLNWMHHDEIPILGVMFLNWQIYQVLPSDSLCAMSVKDVGHHGSPQFPLFCWFQKDLFFMVPFDIQYSQSILKQTWYCQQNISRLWTDQMFSHI